MSISWRSPREFFWIDSHLKFWITILDIWISVEFFWNLSKLFRYFSGTVKAACQLLFDQDYILLLRFNSYLNMSTIDNYLKLDLTNLFKVPINHFTDKNPKCGTTKNNWPAQPYSFLLFSLKHKKIASTRTNFLWFQSSDQKAMVGKRNNILANAHFHKDWKRRVRTWFNQPARKERRQNARKDKVRHFASLLNLLMTIIGCRHRPTTSTTTHTKAASPTSQRRPGRPRTPPSRSSLPTMTRLNGRHHRCGEAGDDATTTTPHR